MMSTNDLKATDLTLILPSSGSGAKSWRADKALMLFKELPSRSQVKCWFQQGFVRRGNKVLEPSTKVYWGDVLVIHVPPVRQMNLEPRSFPLNIFYEDEDLLIIYKPKGLSMHPGASKDNPTTLVHGLLAYAKNLSSMGGNFRPGIVHRLDKDTEGLVVVAKNNFTHEKLAEQFSKRTIDRAYFALCFGKFPNELTIEAPMGRHPVQRKKMAVTEKGRPAFTYVRRLQYFEEGYSWVECRLKTGRTHQVRVHMSHVHHPLLGDAVYGKKRAVKWSEDKQKAYENLNGQALVAYKLGFIHPRTQEKLIFEVPPPFWMQSFLKKD